MHKTVIAKVLGLLLLVLGLLACVPLGAAWYSQQALWPWLIMIGSFMLTGSVLAFIGRHTNPERDLGIREGVAVTTLFWLASSLLASLGIYFALPESNFVQTWFEAMSGLTTTSSSIFGSTDSNHPFSLSQLDNGILIWRALLQWLGGIGIVVISIALIPLLIGGSGFKMYRAEMPGLNADRLSPRLATTAQIILGVYFVFTLLITVLLIACGVSPFHAICHGMSTVSTGGFSSFDNNIEGMQSHLAEWILICAMILGALNFSLLLTALRGKPLNIWRNTEARAFLIILLCAWAICALSLATQSEIYTNKHDLIRDSLFQVCSIGSSTGFATGFDQAPNGWNSWPSPCIIVIIALMICGGCAGSTAGGIKIVRLLLSIASARRELRRFIEPARVSSMTIDKRKIEDPVLLQVAAYVAIFGVTIAIGTLVLAFLGNDLSVSFSAALTSVSNIGPGMGEIGGIGGFRNLNDPSLLVSTFLMLIGRLELLGALMTLRPKHWR